MNTLETFKVTNQICLITGGAGFLAYQHALAILDGGGKVVLVDIDKEGLSKQKERLGKDNGNKVFTYTLDITQEPAVKSIVEKVTQEVGPISILINNAANNPKVEKGRDNWSRLENLPLEGWDGDLAVGLTGAFLMAKYVGPLMAQNKKGVILNISSDLGLIAPDQRIYQESNLASKNQPVKPVTYSVVKHGLIGLSKYLATYWPKEQVRVNTVCFGGVENGQPQAFIDNLTNLIPLGRMARADEYRGVVLFMCSEASSYMTGATVVIDGGRTVW